MTDNKLDSLIIHPSSINVEEERIGEEKRMADGTLRFFQRAIKLKWTLTWDSLDESWFTSLKGKGNSNDVIVYQDEFGDTYNTLAREFTHDLSAEKISLDNTYHYDITIVLKEV